MKALRVQMGYCALHIFLRTLWQIGCRATRSRHLTFLRQESRRVAQTCVVGMSASEIGSRDLVHRYKSAIAPMIERPILSTLHSPYRIPAHLSKFSNRLDSLQTSKRYRSHAAFAHAKARVQLPRGALSIGCRQTCKKTHVCATRRDRYQMAFTVGPFVGLDAVGKVKVTAAFVITSTDSPSNRGGS